MKDYNIFKSVTNELERLHTFKKPFTDFINTVIYTNTHAIHETHEDMCEFFLLQDSEEEFENIDLELETTALKLARLLELKEIQLKEDVKHNIKS